MNEAHFPPLRAGAAKVVTTPSEPLPLAGFYDRRGLNEGVHDDLHARAVVFESKGVEAAIVGVDICLMSEVFCSDTASRIERETGIPREHVLLNASHTHSGPALYEPDDSCVIDPSFLDDNPWIDGQKLYTEELKELIVAVVADARSNLVPASIGYGRGISTIGINRREAATDGMTIGVNEKGPIDRDLIVVRVDSTDGAPIAALFNLGVHGVSMMSRMVSGDWCGIAAQTIEQKLGGGVVAPFLSGAAGNVNTLSVAKTDFDDPGGAAPSLAETVAEEAVRVYDGIVPCGGGPVRGGSREVALPGKRYLGLLGFDPRYDAIAKDTSLAPDTRLTMSALRIGPVAFGATTAETFCEIGMAFKKRSPLTEALFMGITNGYASYVLTDDEMKRGGYEYNATVVARGGEQAIVDTLVDMIGGFME